MNPAVNEKLEALRRQLDEAQLDGEGQAKLWNKFAGDAQTIHRSTQQLSKALNDVGDDFTRVLRTFDRINLYAAVEFDKDAMGLLKLQNQLEEELQDIRSRVSKEAQRLSSLLPRFDEFDNGVDGKATVSAKKAGW